MGNFAVISMFAGWDIVKFAGKGKFWANRIYQTSRTNILKGELRLLIYLIIKKTNRALKYHFPDENKFINEIFMYLF